MPIYEYVCQSCNTKFEKLVRSMSDSAPIACPKCQSTQTQRALSVFAVQGEPATAGAASHGGHVHSGGCCCGRGNGSCPNM